MKRIPILLAGALSALMMHACSKKYNNGVDHTVGLANISRQWTGTTWGHFADTTMTADTQIVNTAKPYSRNIDTTLSVQKYDTYSVKVMGTLLRYRTTDSSEQTIKFDTTFAYTSEKTVLTYYFAKDSMTYEYHRVKDANPNPYSGKYIEEHWKLRTKRS